MTKKYRTTNENLKDLIKDLNSLYSKNKVNLWKRIAKDLNKPSRQKREINLSKIDKFAQKDETIVVPGKVLGTGELTKKRMIAAWKFSEIAKEKINKNGKAISIKKLMTENPNGKKVRILG